MLGIACIRVLVMSRSRWSCTSRCLRSVMSIPPATMLVTRPTASLTGALPHSITRCSPRAFTNVFSYCDGGKSGAASLKRPIMASRSLASMKTSQKNCPRIASSSSSPLASSVASFWFRIRPSVPIDDEEARAPCSATVCEEQELGAELGLEPHVLERQARAGRDEVDEIGLVVERGIVDESGDLASVPLDRRHERGGDATGALDRAAVARRPSRRGSSSR